MHDPRSVRSSPGSCAPPVCTAPVHTQPSVVQAPPVHMHPTLHTAPSVVHSPTGSTALNTPGCSWHPQVCTALPLCTDPTGVHPPGGTGSWGAVTLSVTAASGAGTRAGGPCSPPPRRVQGSIRMRCQLHTSQDWALGGPVSAPQPRGQRVAGSWAPVLVPPRFSVCRDRPWPQQIPQTRGPVSFRSCPSTLPPAGTGTGGHSMPEVPACPGTAPWCHQPQS